MEDKNKIKVANILSLMERTEKHGTYSEAMENKIQHINEAVAKNRVRVTRNEIIDILNQQDEKGNGGKFACITYVKPESIYKTKRNWRSADVTNALNNYQDRGGEDWYQKISGYNQDGVKGNNPISGVIAVQRYILNWTREENYNKAYSEYKDKLSDLRMRNGIAISTDGTLGDNRNQRTKSDYGVQFNQNGNLSKDFNTAKAKVKSTCYIVDSNGNVTNEIPNDIIKSMKALPSPMKPEKEAAAILSGAALDAYMSAKKELNATFKSQNFLFDRILCISANVNGNSYYYINDALKSPIATKSDVYVNPSDMVKIAEEQLGESFDEIQGFSF